MAAAARGAIRASRGIGTATSAWRARRWRRSRTGSATRCRRNPSSEDLPGVHQAVRIEGLLDRAHEVELEGTLVALDFLALQHAQPMLGADRAAERAHHFVDNVVHFRRFEEKLRRFLALGLGAVVVDVAVADVA